MKVISRLVLTASAVAASLAFVPAAALGFSSPIQLGTSAGAPGVAVDASGTGYAAWLAGENVIDFCKVPLGAKACSASSAIPSPTGSGVGFFGTPLVVVGGSDVAIFIDTDDPANADDWGLDEYVSTNGGQSFAPTSHAVGFTNGYAPTSLVSLPDGNYGVGWVGGGYANPTFQVNSFASPTDYSQQTVQGPSQPYATINPPSDSYAIDDSTGGFASLLSGSSAGVLGVFTTGGQGPCTANTDGLVYSFASATSNLNSSSSWSPLAEVDCTGTSPAVAAGPSGYGLLENEVNASTADNSTVYRTFTPPSTFGAPVTLSRSGEGSPSLSQDGGGRIYATWEDFYNGVQLAFSGDRGAGWVTGTLNAKAGGGQTVASAVDASGQGWVVYTENDGDEYAQSFGPPAPDKVATSQTAGSKHGSNLTIKAGATGEADRATITGVDGASATGRVNYALYSSATCAASKVVFDGGAVEVHDGAAGPSKRVEKKLRVGKYFWRAFYGGDIANAAGASTCGSEVLTVVRSHHS